MTASKQNLFTLNRDLVVRSILGHAVRFIKDEPVHVPREMYEAVLQVGAQPAEAIVVDENTQEHELTADQREDAINAAFAKIVSTNKREDFAGTGIPKDKAVEKLTGLDIDAKELQTRWKKFTQNGGV